MTDKFLFLLIPLCALGSGLIAGVFFAFSAFVMKALVRIPAASGIAVMQSINIVVINPWFMGAFFGTGVLCLALLVLVALAWNTPGAVYLLAGSVLYLVGTIGVTMACNVPRNNALAAMDPAHADSVRAWELYISEWTFWNHVRTIAAFSAAALFIVALL